jgi:DNA-binding MarR family transcriptional regulator
MIGQTIPESRKREAERHRAETEANRHLIREIPPGVSAEAEKISKMRTEKQKLEVKTQQYRRSERGRQSEGLPRQRNELTGNALTVLRAFEQRGTWTHRSEVEALTGIEGQALGSVIQRLQNAQYLERSEGKEADPKRRHRQYMYRAKGESDD